MMGNNLNTIFSISFDAANHNVQLNIDLLTIGIILLVILVFLIIRYLHKSKKLAKANLTPVELNIEIGGVALRYKIERNYTNIEIAHKIYIELITRKAAILFDDENDLICDIYDSWYNLFQITRNEIKNLTGDLLGNNTPSNDLVELTTDILNKGLRPHLTQFQAKFRKWFNEENSRRKTESPQIIQKEFYEYNTLIKSLKEVNQLLIEYASKLKGLING